jgi:hypothetical protein
MKKLLILFLLICSTAYAEDVVTYSGTKYLNCQSFGDSNIWLTDPNDITTPKDGYLYAPNGCANLPGIAKYRKIANGEVVEMSKAEKDAVDSAELASQVQAQKTQFNALIDQAKAEVDLPKSVSSLLNICITNITTDEIRNLKSGTPKATRTDQKLKDDVKACLESLKQ